MIGRAQIRCGDHHLGSIFITEHPDGTESEHPDGTESEHPDGTESAEVQEEPKTHGNGEIRSSEVAYHRRVDPDDLAQIMEERATGTAGGRLSVINDPVGQDVADVSLCGNRPD